MIKIDTITICGDNNNYEFKLPKEIEIPEDVMKSLRGDSVKSMFIILSLLGIEYTTVGKIDPKPEPEAE